MGKYKVCAYAICKNESKFVNRWMEHAKEADLVVVTDTGSDDDTVEKLRQQGALVYRYQTDPFRFDTSRNFCLEHIPTDVDICVSSDLDDFIEPGWREKLENVWQPDTTRGLYIYNWSFYKNGEPAVQYTHERIHARHHFHWIYPTHEVLEYTGPGEEKRVFIEGLIYNHYPDPSKDRSLNLPLLELAVRENPKDARNLHYLGREYMFEGKWSACIETLTRYLLPGVSSWNEERSASMRFIARAYGGLGDTYEQKRWLWKAIAEAPFLREPYVEAALLAYEEEDWPAVYFYTNRAISITSKTYQYANDTRAWNERPHDLAALACYHLGLAKEVVLHSIEAMRMAPDDQRLKNNHVFYEQAAVAKG